MDTLEYRVIDKSAWERGPWDNEPDKMQWPDEATGLPCLIVRGPHGALCGYVGVSPGHPWHGKGYDDCRLYEAAADDWDAYPNVHGGLTFADGCGHGADPSRAICHIPGPGEPDDVWWLGFDCAHAGDYTSMKHDQEWRERWPHCDDVYRDVSYVRAQCRSLAAQAMSARQGQDPQGLEAQPASAVAESDAP